MELQLLVIIHSIFFISFLICEDEEAKNLMGCYLHHGMIKLRSQTYGACYIQMTWGQDSWISTTISHCCAVYPTLSTCHCLWFNQIVSISSPCNYSWCIFNPKNVPNTLDVSASLLISSVITSLDCHDSTCFCNMWWCEKEFVSALFHFISLLCCVVSWYVGFLGAKYFLTQHIFMIPSLNKDQHDQFHKSNNWTCWIDCWFLVGWWMGSSSKRKRSVPFVVMLVKVVMVIEMLNSQFFVVTR